MVIAQERMKVSMSASDLRFVDDVLGELKHERRIVLNVPLWPVVPHVLARTDMLAVMPGRPAAALVDDKLRMFDLPFASASFFWMMYWHRRHDRNNANRWLRDHVRRACATSM